MQRICARRERNCLGLVATIMTMVACGGGSPDTSDNSVENNSGPAPLATVTGTPVGGQSSATIGASGGTLGALDESLSVTIPAGALTSATEIAIQPITNTAPGGLGNGYRLAPAGQVFKRPLDITFAYGDLDLDDTPVANLGVITQSVGGYWRLIEGAVVDEGARTVTVAVTHFSDFSLFRGLGVYPYMFENENGEEEPKRIEYCFDPQEDIEKEVIPAEDPSRLDDEPQHEPRYLCFGPFSGQPLPFDEDDYSDADDEGIEQPARTYEGNLRYSVENEGISVTLSGDVTWLEGDAGSDGFLASGKMNFSVSMECSRIDEQGQLHKGEAKFAGAVGFQGEMTFGVPAEDRYTFALGTNWDDAQLVCNGISVPYGVLLVSGRCDGASENESLIGDGRLLEGSTDCGDGTRLGWSFARTK